jgi:hypothetical protein
MPIDMALNFAGFEKMTKDEGFLEDARRRKLGVKLFLMDQHVVVGVGNIYASEALFRAGVRPRRAAGRIKSAEWQRIVAAVRQVLGEAIRQGGTTLRDYVNADGTPGYFRQELFVYERAGEPCRRPGRQNITMDSPQLLCSEQVRNICRNTGKPPAITGHDQKNQQLEKIVYFLCMNMFLDLEIPCLMLFEEIFLRNCREFFREELSVCHKF